MKYKKQKEISFFASYESMNLHTPIIQLIMNTLEQSVSWHAVSKLIYPQVTQAMIQQLYSVDQTESSYTKISLVGEIFSSNKDEEHVTVSQEHAKDVDDIVQYLRLELGWVKFVYRILYPDGKLEYTFGSNRTQKVGFVQNQSWIYFMSGMTQKIIQLRNNQNLETSLKLTQKMWLLIDLISTVACILKIKNNIIRAS